MLLRSYVVAGSVRRSSGAATRARAGRWQFLLRSRRRRLERLRPRQWRIGRRCREGTVLRSQRQRAASAFVESVLGATRMNCVKIHRRSALLSGKGRVCRLLLTGVVWSRTTLSVVMPMMYELPRRYRMCGGALALMCSRRPWRRTPSMRRCASICDRRRSVGPRPPVRMIAERASANALGGALGGTVLRSASLERMMRRSCRGCQSSRESCCGLPRWGGAEQASTGQRCKSDLAIAGQPFWGG